MRIVALLCVLSTLCIISCKKTDSELAPGMAKIAGKWNWIKTTRGWSPTITPATENYIQEVLFLSNGTYVLYRNREVMTTGPFSIDSIAGGRYQLSIDGGVFLATVFTGNSQMNYGDGAADGFQYFYERR